MLARAALLAVSLVAVLGAGVWIGVNHAAFVPAFLVEDEESRVVLQAIDEVQDTFYRDVPADRLADLAIGGLVDGLDDRFSTYFDPREYAQVQQQQRSQFSGIGVQVTGFPADPKAKPRGLVVKVVYEGSPAAKAGLEPGDRIVGVDGRTLRGVEQEQAVRWIKGPEGTEVRLTIQRDGRRLEKTLRRATVNVPVVASRVRTVDGKKVGVISLAAFSSGAHAEVYRALREVQEQGADSVVFDLRGNGGGFVNEAQLIASAFLPEGPIVTTRGRGVEERTLTATGQPVLASRIPVAVLVDGDTASASEIVAGALQDRNRATVVGTKTFGKGVFQEVIELPNGGALDITAGKYFTPKGRNLGGTGLRPDVRAKDDLATEDRDEALQRALDVVTSPTT